MRTTKYLRIRLDFAVELAEPTDNTAVFEAKLFHDAAFDKLLEAVSETDQNKRAMGIAPGFASSFALDMRKRDEQGKVR